MEALMQRLQRIAIMFPRLIPPLLTVVIIGPYLSADEYRRYMRRLAAVSLAFIILLDVSSLSSSPLAGLLGLAWYPCLFAIMLLSIPLGGALTTFLAPLAVLKIYAWLTGPGLDPYKLLTLPQTVSNMLISTVAIVFLISYLLYPIKEELHKKEVLP